MGAFLLIIQFSGVGTECNNNTGFQSLWACTHPLPSFNLPPGRAVETINTIFEGFRVDQQDNLLISEKISDVTLLIKTSFIFISKSFARSILYLKYAKTLESPDEKLEAN